MGPLDIFVRLLMEFFFFIPPWTQVVECRLPTNAELTSASHADLFESIVFVSHSTRWRYLFNWSETCDLSTLSHRVE